VQSSSIEINRLKRKFSELERKVEALVRSQLKSHNDYRDLVYGLLNLKQDHYVQVIEEVMVTDSYGKRHSLCINTAFILCDSMTRLDVSTTLRLFAESPKAICCFFREIRSLPNYRICCYPLKQEEASASVAASPEQVHPDMWALLYTFAKNLATFMDPAGEERPHRRSTYSKELSWVDGVMGGDKYEGKDVVRASYFFFLAALGQSNFVVNLAEWIAAQRKNGHRWAFYDQIYLMTYLVSNDEDLIALASYLAEFDGTDGESNWVYANRSEGGGMHINRYISTLAPVDYYGAGITLREAARVAAHRKVARVRYKLNQEKIMPHLPDELWRKIDAFAQQKS
jgi:hypothetical protein